MDGISCFQAVLLNLPRTHKRPLDKTKRLLFWLTKIAADLLPEVFHTTAIPNFTNQEFVDFPEAARCPLPAQEIQPTQLRGVLVMPKALLLILCNKIEYPLLPVHVDHHSRYFLLHWLCTSQQVNGSPRVGFIFAFQRYF